MVLSFSSALRKAQTLRGPQSGQARCGRTAAWRWQTVLGEGGYHSQPGAWRAFQECGQVTWRGRRPQTFFVRYPAPELAIMCHKV